MFYGAGSEDFSAANAAFLGHFCEEDKWEPREGVEAFEASLREANRPTTFHFYPNVQAHWFFEQNRDAYRPEAAELAWQRTLAFLADSSPKKTSPCPRGTEELLARIVQGRTSFQSAISGRTAEQIDDDRSGGVVGAGSIWRTWHSGND